MKILIAGSFKHWNALESHYVRFLTPHVEKMQFYPWPDLIGDYYSSSLIRKVQYRFKFCTKNKLDKFNDLFYQHIVLQKPDIVWVFKGVDLFPERIKAIKDLGVKVANYNPDHPFIRTFRSGGGDEVELSVPLYDLFFCYSKDLMDIIQQKFDTVRTVFLPFGFQMAEGDLAELNRHRIEQSEKKRLCFIGNPDNELRFQALNALIQKDLPIDIYGLGWDKYFGSELKQARIFPGVYGSDYWRTLREYRVQINIFRPHNINSHNMRTFEIPAVGGIQLAPYSEEHEIFFEEGKEIFLYKSTEELIKKARYILELSDEQAFLIRENARLRSSLDDYSYEGRSKIVLKAFKELLNEL